MGGTMSEIPETPAPAPAPETATPYFSWLGMIGGLLLALAVGACANVIAGLIGGSTNVKLFAFLIGIVPGLIFIGLARLAWRSALGFATGMLVGGFIVSLVGGVCGASMVNMSFR
jgi:hypothetical protein